MATKTKKTTKTAKKMTRKSAPKKVTKSKRVAKKVQPIPKHYSTVIPAFRVANCAAAMQFLQEVFGAKVKDRYDGPGGEVMHCELRIGVTTLMCGEAQGGDVKTLGASVYVKNCDAAFDKAVSLGAKVKQPLTNQFYGDRVGRVVDPCGNEWMIATHIEDVSRKEILRRMQAMTPPQQQQPAAEQAG